MGITYGDSWAEVCSRALGALGKGRISSLSTGDQNVGYCNLYLGQAIANVIAQTDWHALRTRLQLAPSSTEPVYGYDYAYPLPADFERLISIDNDGEAYSFEGVNVLTDAAEVYITYIARPIDDPSKLPSVLKDYISAELAVLLSSPMAASESKIQKIMADRDSARRAALSNNAKLNEESIGEAVRGFGYYEDLR